METQAQTTKLSGFAHYLVTHELLSEEQAKTYISQATQQTKTLITLLAQESIIDSTILSNAVAQYFGLPIFELDSLDESSIPKEFLQNPIVQMRQGLPFFVRGDYLTVAIADPTIRSLDNITFLTGLKTTFVVVDYNKLMKRIEGCSENTLKAVLDEISDADLDALDITSGEAEVDNDELDKAPVVRYINKILLDAINKGASDIHFEPYDKSYRIRFRLDGILTEITTPPAKMSKFLTARLKIMANLDISERRVPQDGRFKLKISNTRSIDFRVSSCPTTHGEKIVLRILESSDELLDINLLGLSEAQKKLFQHEIRRNQGMILVTGPTGCGKTVTLYTGMKILNTSEKNISTVEDPIEIQLQGINQVQVNLKAGMTFATALRAFMRQDPDVIMVGEIRDLETAEIAIKASQTGHLVLSTLHTNSAPETLVRLSNMGIPAYNIVSAVSLIVAQRLVRKLCETCKKPFTLPEKTLLDEGFTQEDIEDLTLYAPNGCEMCNDGYRGRVGIYEVLPITNEMSRIILKSLNSIDLEEQARKENIPNLRQSGLEKVKEGLTSLDEVNRIIKV